jgi:carboxyl-terminal processing protease
MIKSATTPGDGGNALFICHRNCFSTILVFLLLSMRSFSQTPVSEPDKIATFCKVWGFLKYHHPAVAKGKYDWDKEFMEQIKVIEQLQEREEINRFYFNWISHLGKLKENARRSPPANAVLSNYDLAWLTDTSAFEPQVTRLLLLTQNNSTAKNHYVKRRFLGIAAASYINEKDYKDSSYPSVAMRLLVLSRYWNIVNYFYPYKYLADENWQCVINEFVPLFIHAENVKNYRLTLLALFAKINDSHTGFNPHLYGSDYKIPPFNNKIVDDKIIVLNAFNDSICRKHDIRYGDVILKISGQSIKSLINYYSKYISASNYASLCVQLAPQTIWAAIPKDAVITCERDGIIFDKILPDYPRDLLIKDFQRRKEQSLPDSTACHYKIINNHIAYINLGKFTSRKDIREVLHRIKNTDAVILDIRNYPNGSIFRPITNFFCTSRKPFAKFALQSIKYPGALIWERTVYCGKKGGEKYKGKVVVLTYESTMSYAEYFTMALCTIPNVTLIGSHTAGADGGNKHFVLPGNIITSFSNEGVYFPNGDETQRKGIIPHISVTPTIEGLRHGKDEALEKAIEVLSK